MDQIKVERGIPIPPPGMGKGQRNRYPWAALNVGDSFYVQPRNGTTALVLQKRLVCIAREHGLKFGKKFTTRQVDGGVRVWRTE